MRKVRRLVFVVSPGQRPLYESLRRTFADDATVEIVLDRRRREGDRRQRAERSAADRRRADRRRRSDVETKLALRGYAVVGVVAVKPSGR